MIAEWNPVYLLLFFTFLLSIIFGIIAQKTLFCPLGGIADWLQQRNTGRLGMYFLAIATAIAGVTVLEALGLVDFDHTRPPYRMAQFRWPGYVLGGLLFGIGMTLCRGCGMRSMLNFGSGNLKALVAIIGMGAAAVLLLYVEGIYETFFLSWISPISPDLSLAGFSHSDLGTLVSGVLGVEVAWTRMVIGTTLAAILLMLVFRSADFRGRKANIVGGLAIGLLVVTAYYLTGGSFGEAAKEASEFMEQPQNGMGTQSYTFIRPMGDMLYLSVNPLAYLITFGLVAFFGVGVGSLLISLLTRGFQLRWFSSNREFFRYLAGGLMVGLGGILGLGCTLGQGIAGASTLALGSFVNLLFILLGAVIGIKLQSGFINDHQVPIPDRES